MRAAEHIDLRERSRAEILAELGDCPDVTLVRGPGGLADELMCAGTRLLLSDRRYREIDVEELCASGGRTALLMGSGAFSRAYHEWMPLALAVAEMRFERVILLPSSFDVMVEEVRAALRRTRAVVFAREPRSFDAIRGLCDARLALDGAFYYDYEPHRRDGAGVLNAFRTDLEAPRHWPLPPGNIDIPTTAGSLTAWLDEIARHAIVRTNRVHVMIAAALLGKQVEVGPCDSFKVDALADYALHEFPLRRLRDPPGLNRRHPPPDRAVDTLRIRLRACAMDHARRAPGTAREHCDEGRARNSASLRVTAIVLNHDRLEPTQRAVESVLVETKARALVLDSNSASEVRESLAAAFVGEPRVDVVLMDRNLGCGGGRLHALELVDTEFVMMLDSDAEVMPFAIERLVAELDAHPEALAATPCVVLADGRVAHCGGELRERDDLVEFRPSWSGADPFADQLGPSRCDWVPHTAVLVRRAAFEEFPIDPEMTAYYEDNEWSYRVAKRRDSAFRSCPGALVLHHLAPSRYRPVPVQACDFYARCLALPVLAAIACFHRRHGRVIGGDLFRIVPGLTRPDGSCDIPAARLLLMLLDAFGPERFLMLWSGRELEPILATEWSALARELTEQLSEAGRALSAAGTRTAALDTALGDTRAELERVSGRLEEVRATRVWRLACTYYRARGAGRAATEAIFRRRARGVGRAP